MALFGDSTSDPSVALLLPQAATAFRYDPRTLLAQSIMQSGQQSLQQPTYSPLAGLAKALTIGLGGASEAYLQNQYQQAQKGAPQDIAAALQSKNPVNALLNSSNPFARMMGYQLGPKILEKQMEPYSLRRGETRYGPGGAPVASNTQPNTQIGQLMQERDAIAAGNPNDPRVAAYNAQIAKMNQEGGVAFGPNGAAAIPGYGQAKANIAAPVAGATAAAEFPYKAGESLLQRAGQVHNVGQNERAVTGFQAIPGLAPSLDRVLGPLGISLGTGAQVPPPATASQPPSAAQRPATPTPSVAASGVRLSSPPPAPNPSVVTPTEKPPATMQATSPQESAPPPGIDPKLWSEIPAVKAPSTPIRGAGGVIQGVSSSQVDMEKKANAEKEAIDKAGEGANDSLAQLTTLQNSLASGQFNTNATAPMRATMSAYINALGGRDLAKTLTGIDPAQADVFNKEATRMGLTFARQTEGAREAVAAIKIALGGNPSMSNTVEGNKMILEIMKRAAGYDVATQRASDAFYLKNGHNVTFSGWWNKEHPATDWTTGKVDPYPVPVVDGAVDQKMLIPGFTYQSPSGQIGVWTGKGFKAAQ